MLEETQVCITCEIEKSLTEYYKDKRMKNGYKNECKECVKERRKKRYEENKDEVLEYNKQYYKANASKLREDRMKKYYGKK
ncbi:hypothetical protein ACEN33_00615 [Ruoffia sp. FAM 24228]|uniref:hypothetical protein n=1 Tax=Ruoffia sp. FAM 24228 TaxID=3259517 RepID=UPI00388AB8ED